MSQPENGMFPLTHEDHLRGYLHDKITLGEINPTAEGYDESRVLGQLAESYSHDHRATRAKVEAKSRAELEQFNADVEADLAKPGPPKLFPAQFNLRLSQHERSALDRIAASTKEDRAVIIRRLILEADPGPLQ